MIRKKNKFSWPRKIYDKTRINDENKLVEEYGLKNKKEIWKAEAKIKYFRNRAKFLITGSHEEKEHFFNKLVSIGLPVKTIAEVLALNKEDLLRRRLSTIVWKRGLANTARQARQLIVHKNVLVEGRAINIPGYIVSTELESNITLKNKIKTKMREIVE
jgi:small subunit ribosomal protein S4